LGYHVWGIFERHDNNMDDRVRPDSELDKLIESVGARGRGDAAARQYCRDTVQRLNDEWFEKLQIAGI
jgi:hypothetical protein